jgi:hypothetical protein
MTVIGFPLDNGAVVGNEYAIVIDIFVGLNGVKHVHVAFVYKDLIKFWRRASCRLLRVVVENRCRVSYVSPLNEK